MIAFRVAVLASPLVLGFGLPFLLAFGRRWNLRKRAGAVSIGVASWILFLGLLWPFSGESVHRFLESACFLLAFSAFLFGLYFLLESLVPSFAQAGCGLVVLLMVGTLFYFDPIVEHAQASGLPRESFQRRVDLALEWNPYAVMAYSIFEEDLLTRRLLYSRTLLSDLQRSYPDWTRTALGYVLLGFWFFILRIGIVTIRWRLRAR